MLVRQNSGTMSAPADAWPSESGGTCAIRKKTRAAIHNDSAGATALNASRVHPWPRRQDITMLSTASATVAGAGPNSKADVMTNVSDALIVASIEATRIVNDPVASARNANAAHSSGCGARGSAAIDCTTASAPTAPMTWTYRRSAAGDLAGGLAPACRGAVIGSAGVGRGQHRAAPDDLVVQRRLVRAPDDLLPQRIVEPVAPVDHVPVRVGRHLPPDQRTGIDERQRVFQPREVQVSEPEE